MKHDKNKPMTVEHLKRFLDNFADSAPVLFIVDSAKAKVWEMYGGLAPIISLQTVITAQDHIELLDEPDNAS